LASECANPGFGDNLEIVTETSAPTAESTIYVRQMHPCDTQAAALLTAQLGYERTADQIAAWIAQLDPGSTEQVAFVACVGAEVVGWIEVSVERRLQSAPFGMIGGLVVSDRVRNRGIGRLLCERAEQWVWDQGFDTLRVTSRSTRTDAHRFYLRDGYREVKTSLVFEKRRSSKTNRP
jgi:GNAT superfamily N-acetyltransferase